MMKTGMKSIGALLLLLACSMLSQKVWSQTLNSLPLVDNIKSDDSYLWGEGRGDTDAEADRQALIDLSSKIAVRVVGKFDVKESELRENGVISSSNVTNSLMQTYTSAMLPNTQGLFISHEPHAYAFRYIHRSEVHKIFEERRLRAEDLTREAMACERKGRIDDALRQYYWALCLVKSLQHPLSATLKIDDREKTLLDWIPMHMGEIFDNLHTEVSGVNGNEVQLFITYKGEPLSSVDYSYWTGSDYTPPRGAKGGIATVVLPTGMSADNIKLRYEYQYRGRMNSDPILEHVMTILKSESMPKSEQTAHWGTKKEQRAAQAQFQQAVASVSTAAHSVQVEKPKEMTKVIDRVLKAVRERQYAKVEDCFTPDGYQMFNTLLNYGQARILGNPQLTFWQMGERTVCRSVPMTFAFKNNRREFTEDVTFTFDASGKIESLAFALDQAARDDIFLKERPAWNDSIRMLVATFLENYQTAYALKRADYLETLFAQDALIITGSVLKQAPKTLENNRYLDNEYVRLTRLDKDEYMKRLRKCMASNEYINLHFSETDVRMADKSRYDDVYGILLKQDYYSSSYADTGYLFLVVDMSKVDLPTILVRTWQPRRDRRINANLSDDSPYKGLISGNNFR